MGLGCRQPLLTTWILKQKQALVVQGNSNTGETPTNVPIYSVAVLLPLSPAWHTTGVQ